MAILENKKVGQTGPKKINDPKPADKGRILNKRPEEQ